jgi:hypothetical protein
MLIQIPFNSNFLRVTVRASNAGCLVQAPRQFFFSRSPFQGLLACECQSSCYTGLLKPGVSPFISPALIGNQLVVASLKDGKHLRGTSWSHNHCTGSRDTSNNTLWRHRISRFGWLPVIDKRHSMKPWIFSIFLSCEGTVHRDCSARYHDRDVPATPRYGPTSRYCFIGPNVVSAAEEQ